MRSLRQCMAVGMLVAGGASAQVTVVYHDGVSPDAGYSGTRDVHVEADVYTRYRRDQNHGARQEVTMDNHPVQAHVLLRWDLTSVPFSVQVSAASLELVWTSVGDDFYVAECLRPWVESEATWDLAGVGQPWQDAGALGPADRGATVLGTFDGRSSPVPLTDAGVGLVQRWISSPATNLGLLLGRSDPTVTDGVDFFTSQSPDASVRPALVLGLSDGGVLRFKDGVEPAGYTGTDDTEITFGPPPGEANYNAEPLDVGASGEATAVLLRFDLTDVPPGARVLDAGLSLYVRSGSGVSVAVFEELADWTETGAAWSLRDGVNPWSGDGGALNPVDHDAQRALAGALVVADGGRQSFVFGADGLSTLQAWLAGVRPNHGFLLTSASLSHAFFERREATQVARRPELWLTWDIPDAGVGDAGVPDAGAPDAGAADAGASEDGGFMVRPSLGVACGCSASGPMLLYGLAAALRALTRSRRSSR